jgi:hypothetical protein
MSLPLIHIEVLEEKHILWISYRLKCYMKHISTINEQLYTDLMSLFHIDITNIPNDPDILNIIKILITIDLTTLTTNAVLLNNIKIKLTEYLIYIRLDQRHDFDDPGRCIPKFSYNVLQTPLSACSTFIEEKLSSNITIPVNNLTTLPGLEYYCLDTGLRETSSKKIKQRLDNYFQRQNLNSASIATISQIVDSAGCSPKDTNADSFSSKYLTDYEIYLYNIGFIFYQGFFHYLNNDNGYFIIINQLTGQDKKKYIEKKEFNIEIFNYKFTEGNYNINEFYNSNIIVGQNGFSLPNVCKWISNHMELFEWPPPQQSGLSNDMISNLKKSIGMSIKGYGDFGQIFITTCLNNLNNLDGKLNIFKGKIILFTVDTFLATLAIIAKCPFLLGTIANPCYLHNPFENIRNVNVITYWNNILDNIKIYTKDRYDNPGKYPDYQLAFENMKKYDDNDIIKPIAPKNYFCYDILTDYISGIKLRSIYYIYNNFFISNDNNINIKADTLLRNIRSQLNNYCLYIISECNDTTKKKQAKSLCEYIKTQKDIGKDICENILMVDTHFFKYDNRILKDETYGSLGSNENEILQTFYQIETTGKYYTAFKSIGIFTNYFNLIDNTYTLIISEIKAYTENKFGPFVHLTDDFNTHVNKIALIEANIAQNLNFEDYKLRFIDNFKQKNSKKEIFYLKSIRNIYTFLQTHYLSIKDNTCPANLIKTKTSIFLNFLSKFYVNLLTEIQEIYSHFESIFDILNESNICKINGFRLFITDEGFDEIVNYIKILSEYTENIIKHNNNINEYINLIRNVYHLYKNGDPSFGINPLDNALKVYKYIYENENTSNDEIINKIKNGLDLPTAKPSTYYNLIEIILNYYQHLSDIINSSYKIYCDINIIGKKISIKCQQILKSIAALPNGIVLPIYSRIRDSIKIFNPILVSQQGPPSGPGGPSGYNGGGQGYLVKKEKKNNTYSMSGGSAINSKLLDALINFTHEGMNTESLTNADIKNINIEIDEDATYIEETYVFEDCCKECFDDTLSPLMRPQFNKFNLEYYPKIKQYNMNEKVTNILTNIRRDPERGRDITIEEKESFLNWILNYMNHYILIRDDEILIKYKEYYKPYSYQQETILNNICLYLKKIYDNMNLRYSITIKDLELYYRIFNERKYYDELLNYKYFFIIYCFIDYNKILISKINLPAITLDFTNYLDNLLTLKRDDFTQVDIYDHELLYIYHNISKLKDYAIQNITPYRDFIDIIEIPVNERTDIVNIVNNAIIANYPTTDIHNFVFGFNNFKEHLNYYISWHFFNLIRVDKLTQEDADVYNLIIDGMKYNDFETYINIINTRTSTILTILSDVKIKLLLIDVKYYIQIFETIDIEYIDNENKQKLYNYYNNLLSICDILENHKVYFLKYFFIDAYDKILIDLGTNIHREIKEHFRQKNELYSRQAEFLLEVFLNQKIHVNSEKIKDEDNKIIIENIKYITSNKDNEFVDFVIPEYRQDFYNKIIGLKELYDKIIYLKKVYLIIEINRILLLNNYEHHIFNNYPFIKKILENILNLLDNEIIDNNLINNIIIKDELLNKLLKLFHIIILCKEIIEVEENFILKNNFIKKEFSRRDHDGFDIDFITERIKYLEGELNKLIGVEINEENYMDKLRDISNINSSYSCINFTEYIKAKKSFYSSVLSNTNKKIPMYIKYIQNYYIDNKYIDDFTKFKKKIKFYRRTIESNYISEDNCDNIFKLEKYCNDNMNIMRIIDSILIINLQIYNLVKFNSEVYENKIDKLLLDSYLNDYIECSRILLSDKDVDKILNDINVPEYIKHFKNIYTIQTNDDLINIKIMKMENLNDDAIIKTKEYYENVKKLSGEMDLEFENDKTYTGYVLAFLRYKSSTDYLYNQSLSNLIKKSEGRVSYVPNIVKKTILELNENMKNIHNIEKPIIEKYKRLIDDITKKYCIFITEYKRNLSLIQDEYDKEVRYKSYETTSETTSETTRAKIIEEVKILMKKINDAEEKYENISKEVGVKAENLCNKIRNKIIDLKNSIYNIPLDEDDTLTPNMINQLIAELDEKEFLNKQSTIINEISKLQNKDRSEHFKKETGFFSFLNENEKVVLIRKSRTFLNKDDFFKYFIRWKVFQENNKEYVPLKIIEAEIIWREELTNDYKKYKEVIDSKRQEENKQRELKARQEALKASQQKALEEARKNEEFNKREDLRQAYYEEDRERERGEVRKIENTRENSVLGKLSSYLGF